MQVQQKSYILYLIEMLSLLLCYIFIATALRVYTVHIFKNHSIVTTVCGVLHYLVYTYSIRDLYTVHCTTRPWVNSLHILTARCTVRLPAEYCWLSNSLFFYQVDLIARSNVRHSNLLPSVGLYLRVGASTRMSGQLCIRWVVQNKRPRKHWRLLPL